MTDTQIYRSIYIFTYNGRSGGLAETELSNDWESETKNEDEIVVKNTFINAEMHLIQEFKGPAGIEHSQKLNWADNRWESGRNSKTSATSSSTTRFRMDLLF